MFKPKMAGTVCHVTGRDVRARPTYSQPAECAFEIISLDISSQKTQTSSTMSASNGSADQLYTDAGKILVGPSAEVGIGDKFSFDGVDYRIVSVKPEYSLLGPVDHYECGLEYLPR